MSFNGSMRGMKTRSLANQKDPNTILRERCARALGWEPDQAGSISFAALRELVRPVSTKLAHELDLAIQSGSHIIGGSE